MHRQIHANRDEYLHLTSFLQCDPAQFMSLMLHSLMDLKTSSNVYLGPLLIAVLIAPTIEVPTCGPHRVLWNSRLKTSGTVQAARAPDVTRRA